MTDFKGIVKCTKAQYDALETKDADKLYIVGDDDTDWLTQDIADTLYQTKGNYVTTTELTNSYYNKGTIDTKLSGKQNTGDYATNTALTNGLAGKVSKTGDTMTGNLTMSDGTSISTPSLSATNITVSNNAVICDAKLTGQGHASSAMSNVLGNEGGWVQWRTSSEFKADMGLNNVDNTSDLNKPISTATQSALDGKADVGASYTKSEEDTLLSGKASTAQLTTGLAGKQDTLTAGTNITISNNVISASGGTPTMQHYSSRPAKTVYTDFQGKTGLLMLSYHVTSGNGYTFTGWSKQQSNILYFYGTGTNPSASGNYDVIDYITIYSTGTITIYYQYGGTTSTLSNPSVSCTEVFF